jgi:hypothetical protein
LTLAVHGFLERPPIRKRVLELLLDGQTPRQIAAAISTKRATVSHQAITKFRDRHAATHIEPVVKEVERQVSDYAIASKVNRVAELQHLYDLTRAEVDAYGITIVETRTETRGDTETVYVTRDYRSGLVKEARGILDQVSEELGQKPKADQNINLRAQVIVRQVKGFDPERLG